MNTNIEFAYCQENVEVAAYKHKHYGHGVYYDITKESYDEAYDRASKIMWQKIIKDNPQIQWHDEEKQYSLEPHKIVPPNSFISTSRKAEKDVLNFITSLPINQSEKINKGTIEEQIQACTELSNDANIGLYSFELFAKANPKYKKVYDKKFEELEQKLQKQFP